MLEGSSSNFVIGTPCPESPTLEMRWIWTTTGNKLLLNVKTLKCIQSQGRWKKVEMRQCKKTSDSQKIECTKSNNGKMKIKWKDNLFLNLKSTYVYSNYFWDRWPRPLWRSEKTSCETSTAYKGKQNMYFQFYLFNGIQMNMRQPVNHKY